MPEVGISLFRAVYNRKLAIHCEASAVHRHVELLTCFTWGYGIASDVC